MARASIKLPDGTTVDIQGSPEEVAKVLSLYNTQAKMSDNPQDTKDSEQARKRKRRMSMTAKGKRETANEINPAQIIEKIKDSEYAEAIDSEVLDKVSQVNRVLLPLFILQKFMDNQLGLTSGDISRITTDLGIPISTPNASNILSGTASKYVIGDKTRKRGQPVRYKLSRRGTQYFTEVLSGGNNGK